MLEIKLDKQFKKDIKRDQKSGKFNQNDFKELKKVMDNLIEEIPIESKYLEHKLHGEWRDYLECHLKPNWLLIYKITYDEIRFARLGTHQQLFKKY